MGTKKAMNEFGAGDNSTDATQQDLQLSNILGDDNSPAAEILRSAIKSHPDQESLKRIEEASKDLQEHTATLWEELIAATKETISYIFSNKAKELQEERKRSDIRLRGSQIRTESELINLKKLQMDLAADKISHDVTLHRLRCVFELAKSEKDLTKLRTMSKLVRNIEEKQHIVQRLNRASGGEDSVVNFKHDIIRSISSINEDMTRGGYDAFDIYLSGSDDSNF